MIAGAAPFLLSFSLTLTRELIYCCNCYIPCNYNTEAHMSKKPTIRELEMLLNSEEDTRMEILPNGEIRPEGQTPAFEFGGKKPLTMKENLGGEYRSVGNGY